MFLPRSGASVPHETAEKGAAGPFGRLPTWDLSDFYDGPDAPALAADLAQLGNDAAAFERTYKGTLADRLGGDTASTELAKALSAYEALDDRLGRVASYAGLLYATDTTNPTYAKTYGDISDKLTAFSGHLLFFPLELNRLDDAVIDAALTGEAARFRPFVDDLRQEKPYQLADDLERLFLDKSTPSRGAWTRLFDETIADLRIHMGGAGEKVPLEEALNALLDPKEATRKRASEGIAAALKGEARTFTLITNTLAKDKEISDRWRGFQDVADSRHLSNRVERVV